ncbi:MAG: TPM domain-containing protein [Moraxella sp.]|nr:TPM domain-containing protein [Moraxella sp.]
MSSQVLASSATATATATASAEDEMAAAVVVANQNQAVGGVLKDTAGTPLSPLTDSVKDLTRTTSSNTASNQQNGTATVTAQSPTTSNAPSVTHDKLILNEPVVDVANILSPSEKAHLSEQLRTLYNDNLAQAALVIVPSTQGMPIFDYAMAVADRWQLGKKDTDEGLLIVVAINDRNLYILTGYGLEGVLPDAAVKRIIRDDITPSFKTGQYAQGLSAAIGSISERLRADPETLKRADEAAGETSDDSYGDEGISLMALLIFGIWFGLFLTSILGRFLGATLTAGGVGFFGFMLGAGFMAIPVAFGVWLLLLLFRSGSGRGGRGGGFVVLPTGGGGFGGGGFGSGGFGGGGGGFGGGGAGGSW